MRVIAGRLGGRRLVSFEAKHLRPTTDRVKGSIFNKLGSEVEGRRVLDLFSGTGSLAIESISRGAVHVTAVENHPKSLKIMRQNLAELAVTSEIEILPLDVFKYLARAKQPYDVILIDPPFTEAIADQVMVAVGNSQVIGSGTVVVIEAGRHEKLAQIYGPLVLDDQRDYGDKSVSFFRSN